MFGNTQFTLERGVTAVIESKIKVGWGAEGLGRQEVEMVATGNFLEVLL